MWREGNMTGPTYASAAQSWLASENSSITVVRLVGEQADLSATILEKQGGISADLYLQHTDNLQLMVYFWLNPARLTLEQDL